MHVDKQAALQQRVIHAAETALAEQNYVSPLDVLTGIGFLAPTHVSSWRNGRIDFLERMIQANPAKVSFAMSTFHGWAVSKGLRPDETPYLRSTRAGTVDLRFSLSGDPEIERAYRTHYISPSLSERKRKHLEERLKRAPERVVFMIVRDSQCSECGADLSKNSLLLMEAEQPLCLPCAGLGDLEYLPAGDATLTRRAGKYSARSAPVVRFSRSRGRYERQGLLVEEAALTKAEQECAADADERQKERERAAVQRSKQDDELVERMTQKLQVLFPGCPPAAANAIAKHAAKRGSGRIGRFEAGRNLDEQALHLAVAAAVRHNHTDYDEMLANGLDRTLARARVADHVQEILDAWREGRRN